MFFDALALAAVRAELLASGVPGRVQQVRAVGPLALSLELYGGHRRRYLLLSAHAEHARAHLLTTPPTRDPTIRSPLLLLLRKYLRGAILQSVEQPQFERVLDFGFTKVLPVQRGGPDSEEWEPDDSDESDESDPLEADDRRADIPPGFALYETHLIAEIMGRHSNLVLVGWDGLVLDAIKHIPSSINRVRTTLPHQPYLPPPAQRKLDLLTMGERSFLGEMQGLAPNAAAWQTLVARFRAVSPLLAREAVYRASGNEDTPVAAIEPPRLYAALTELLGLVRTNAWAPSVAWAPPAADDPDEDQTAADEPTNLRQFPTGTAGSATTDDPPSQHATLNTQHSTLALAFAPYALRHLEAAGATLQATNSISAAAEAYFAAVETVAGHAQLKSAVRAELAERRKRLDRRRAALQGELDRAAGFERERHKGELILAYMYGIEPGQTHLTIPEEGLTIKLDPDRTPLEQAQAMFREYQRARAAAAGVPARLEAVDLGLRYLDEIATQLDLAEDHDTIHLLRAELAALPDDATAATPATPAAAKGKRPEPKGKGTPSQRDRHAKARQAGKLTPAVGKESRLATTPAKVVSRDGINIYYGRSARQNDALTFNVAQPDDLWLHARGVPGSHVVIRSGGKSVPESTVAEAARLAARHSKARADTAVDVIVTEKRHVRRVTGAPPGLVTVSNERVLRVRPGSAADEADG
ncbi:MAG: NFACT family protein [Chloroflexota bacterium]|nr:NFACT family protein [Chloroflexota bacterium]